MRGQATKPSRWWVRDLASAVDPISLDPIRTLRYPPFELKADPTSAVQHIDSDWYDGAVLASYLVSTGNFTHPISRRELIRDECAALDEYIAEHRLQGGGVAEAYDLRAEYAAGRPPDGSQLASMRAEAAMILQSLFAGAAARRTDAARSVPTEQAVVADGNMSLVDDDQMPSHVSRSAPAPSAHEAASGASAPACGPDYLGAMAPSARAPPTAEDLFPSLAAAAAAPSSAAPPRPTRTMMPGGSRYNAVRNAWGTPQADTFIGAGHASGTWQAVPNAGARRAAPASQGGAAGSSSSASSSANGSSSAWSAAAAARPPAGGTQSIGRVPTTDAPTSQGAGKSKGQKKAAARQRKAIAASEEAEAVATAADETASSVAQSPAAEAARDPSDASSAAMRAVARDVPAAARDASGSRASSAHAGPRVVRPASVEEAKERHKKVIGQLKARLETGGMVASEATDALRQFKVASAQFLAAAGPTANALAAHAAGKDYLETFLSLFGREGSVHILLELAALMPAAEQAHAFTGALCAKWGLATLPIVGDIPVAAPPPAAAPPPPPPSFAAPRAAASTATASTAARPSSAGIAAAVAPPAPPKNVVAAGPTYGTKVAAASSAMRRAPNALSAALTANSKRPAASSAATPRVTLAYAAAQVQQQQAAAAPAPAPVVDVTDSAGGSSSKSTAAAAAAAAAAQFFEEESAGAAAALRAAMQYSAQPVRRKR